MEEGEEYNLKNLNTILDFKKSHNLPKDQQDIIQIEKFMYKYR